MGYMKELDIELREEVTKRLEKYIKDMETINLGDLEDGGDPLSLIYQDVKNSTPQEREAWFEPEHV
jgi:hypothetical protein